MKCLALIFFLPSFAFACSMTKESSELKSFAKVLSPEKSPQDIEAVGVFFPSKVKNAKASSVDIAYFDGDKLMIQTSIDASDIEDGLEELYKEPNLDGYNVAIFYMNMGKVENVELTVHYTYPVTKDGGMIMCGPMRNHKLSKLLKAK